MIRLLILALIIMLSACSNGSEPYREDRELIPDPEGYQKDTFIPAPADTVPLTGTGNTPK